MAVELLNKECAMVMDTLVANANFKVEHGGQVINKVFADGNLVEPGLWAATYSATDAFVAVRGLPVDSADQDLRFDVELGNYVPPPPPEPSREELPKEVSPA